MTATCTRPTTLRTPVAQSVQSVSATQPANFDWLSKSAVDDIRKLLLNRSPIAIGEMADMMDDANIGNGGNQHSHGRGLHQLRRLPVQQRDIGR